MIDPDVQLPRARDRLLLLCRLLGEWPDPDGRAALTKQIEQTALDIGFVYAVDLLQQGWKPDQFAAKELGARSPASAALAA